MGYKVALATQGTRGDLQPLLPLATELRKRGNEVMFFANPEHCKQVEEFGFKGVASAPEIRDLLQTEAGKKSMETGDLISAVGGMPDDDVDWETPFVEGMEEFAPDLIIFTALIGPAVSVYSFKHPEQPIMPLAYQPNMPTEQYGPTMLYRVPLEEGQPMMSKWQTALTFTSTSALDTWKAAKEAGVSEEELDRIGGPEKVFVDMFRPDENPMPTLLAYSPSFWPAPDDWPKSGYHITGRWMISREEQEERVRSGGSFFNVGADQERCAEFIRAGPTPVYVGWGSMTVYSKEHMATLAVDSLRIAGKRGIIVAGWADVSADSLAGADNADDLQKYCQENILFMKAAPHEWLFPQCACCVHHGGIGTTQASLGAGSPTIVTPVFADQHDIANLVTKNGWGMGTDRLPKLTSEELGDVIRKVYDSREMKAKTEALAEKMRQEDGVKTASGIIEGFIRDDIKTGKWLAKNREHKEKLRQWRKKNEKKTIEQIQSSFTMELMQKFPALRQWQNKQMATFTKLVEAANAGKLWVVKGSSCLARKGEKLKSDEVGRYKEFAFLECIEQKGSRLNVKRLKGIGPDAGWVSTEVKGVEILAKVGGQMEIAKLITESVTKQFADVMDKGNNFKQP